MRLILRSLLKTMLKSFSAFSYNESLKIHRYRKAFTEFLFSFGLTDTVKFELMYQIEKVFGKNIPKNMITVHLRWGNKYREMELVPINEYISAIRKLVAQNKLDAVNIYLATEDPNAADQFEQSCDEHWSVFRDWTLMRTKSIRKLAKIHGSTDVVLADVTNGRYGLECLASIVIAAEAKFFVLTTGSNFSRLINELRTNVIDVRCGNCTQMVDLRQGEY